MTGDYLWTNTNVGEALGSVMTPYTWSIIRQTFDDFYRPPKPLSMVGNIGGRAYLNLSTVLGVVGAFGFAPRTVLEFAAPGLGEVPEDMTTPVTSAGFFRSLVTVSTIMGKVVSAALAQRRYLRWAEEPSLVECAQQLSRVESIDANEQAIELAAELRNIGDESFKMLIRVTNDFMAKREGLKDQLEMHLSQDDVETLVSGLGGDSVLQSMGPMVAIQQVVRGDITREEFIRTYGHRGPDEVELSKPRTGEDPAWIDKLLEQAGDLDVWKMLDDQATRRDSSWQSLARLVGDRRYRKLRKMAESSAEAAQNRELVRSEMIRFMMVPRQLALKVGELTGVGEDLFYLEYDEIEGLLRGEEHHKEQIPARKAAYERYARLPPLPNVISGTIDAENWAENPDRRTDYYDSHHKLNVDDAIRGFAGAAGVVTGTVRVLADHNEGHLLQQGEVLVASFTNVGWTPIFPKAAAVVTDVGAPLSHAAIVARELGVPAVVGTGNATMVLRTGDRVRVDGGAGIVERL